MPHRPDESDAALAALRALVTVLDARGGPDAAGPQTRPDFLEVFLDPAIQAALPESLRPAATVYLDRLPGWREGDVPRALEQHALRVAFWRGEAQLIDEADLTALGLQEEES
ncbi:MAG TPA: hypothetical protein P5330_10830 [Candidatus Competibacteraceae bacterium]|nr:hypothetical protein [Candidatus Competibacteraceae bacterium]